MIVSTAKWGQQAESSRKGVGNGLRMEGINSSLKRFYETPIAHARRAFSHSLDSGSQRLGSRLLGTTPLRCIGEHMQQQQRDVVINLIGVSFA